MPTIEAPPLPVTLEPALAPPNVIFRANNNTEGWTSIGPNDGGYVDLIDFAIAFRTATIWAFRRKLVNFIEGKSLEDIKGLDALLQDYTYELVVQNALVSSDRKRVYVDLLESMPVIVSHIAEGSVYETETILLHDQIEFLLDGKPRASAEALLRAGYMPLADWPKGKKQFIRNIFTAEIWPKVYGKSRPGNSPPDIGYP